MTRRPGNTQTLMLGLVFALTVAGALLGGALIAYGYIERGLEDQLERRLRSYAAAAAAGLSAGALEQLPSGDDPVARLYRGRLAALKQASGVRRIAILRRDGSLLVDTEDSPFGSRDYGFANDANELEACFSRGPLATVAYRDTEGNLYRNGFAPVLNSDGTVAAFAVAVEIEADYSASLVAVRNTMALTVGVVFAVTLLAALVAARAWGRVQRDLQKQTRLAELAQFSAGMAHQIKNPLAALRGYVELLARGLNDPLQKQIADKLISEIGALDRVVRDFLQFSRGSKGSIERITLDQVLRPVLDTARSLAGDTVTIRADNLPAAELEVDSTALREALSNVVNNAAEALREVAAGQVTLRAALRGPEVSVEVADNGPGIPDEIRARLFQPFVTGKADGTGLGLAIARRLLRDLGGDLVLVQTGPAGTIFRATFLKETEP
ncbi:MAG: HAMP domain-containing histidine kinase [Planctomycetes bacterium]|jgi:signal transduction histidine kinase|nr:HAMP domain-containing histidine kinase [Planctomycetota bacterium]MCL4731408.1 HAMP domain-containing histidine kinase [Planctomycetota bacterium]